MKLHTTGSCQQKPTIDYPCIWPYTVIGPDKECIQEAVQQICHGRQITMAFSHSSSGDKYHSYKVELEVRDEEDRLSIYNLFSNHMAIKVVI